MARRTVTAEEDWSARGRFGIRSFHLQLGLALVALLGALLWSYPLTIWEFDEVLFAAAVERFEPLAHHPHPPGYPAYVGIAKALNLAIGDPFTTLVLLSALASLVGFVALALTFRNLLGDGRLAILGALLFYFAPGMLVHSTLALSDPLALAFLALALYHASKVESSFGPGDATALGLTASLCVGCRPQLAILVLPLLILVIMRDGSWKRGSFILGAFAVVSLAWLLPLVIATGGVPGFLRYEFGQVSSFAVNDADLARAGRTWADIAFRFVAHPWGQKFLSLPVLLSAAIGFAVTVVKVDLRLLPVLGACGLYLTFAVWTMDPTDGVRYALPSAMATALLATRGLGWLVPRPKWIPALVVPVVAFGAVAMAYVEPLISQRHTTPSPPVQAVQYAERNLPADTVILFDPPLSPHARRLFRRFERMAVHEGFDELAFRSSVPLWLFADGGTDAPEARMFWWRDSDAYGKLTRNHYRVVSLIEIPPAQRFRSLSGVHALERTPAGQSWRWLDGKAALVLPDLAAKTVTVRLGLPDDYPLGSNRVKVFVNDRAAGEVVPRPRQPAELTMSLPPGRVRLRLDSEKAFVPAEVPRLRHRDRRRLGVMLLFLEQRDETGKPVTPPSAGRPSA